MLTGSHTAPAGFTRPTTSPGRRRPGRTVRGLPLSSPGSGWGRALAKARAVAPAKTWRREVFMAGDAIASAALFCHRAQARPELLVYVQQLGYYSNKEEQI